MLFFFLFSWLLTAALALPIPILQRGIFDITGLLEDVLVFDAPAFPDTADPANTITSLQSFIFRTVDLGLLTPALTTGLNALGLEVEDNKIPTLEERTKLFGTVGIPGRAVNVNIDGCDEQVQLPGSSDQPDIGMVLQNATAGQCSGAKESAARASISGSDGGKSNSTVFFSPNSGFGVISDIDDTVKISNVLDKIALVKSTLLDDPEPVPGMPELYASLVKSLDDPQFIYVSGSPFQLYPFLNDFIGTTYPTSKGPIFLQNLTLVDIPSILDLAKSNGVQEYKVSMIDRIHGMYPNKKFLAVGDSTQRDPETYAEAFNKYKDFITCIWIRRFEGADNSDERFAEAFKGIPKEKFRIYNDTDITSLANINVADGEC